MITLTPARGYVARYLTKVWQTPAQRVVFGISLWFTSNYVSGTLIWPSTVLHPMEMHHMSFLGFIPVTVNGWHLIFHLVTGLAGLAAVTARRSAMIYGFVAGGSYVSFAALGFINGTSVCSMLGVDTFANWVHLGEGTSLIVTALLAARTRSRRSTDA